MLSILVGAAHAFCGAYVGGADSELTNSDSRIVIARNGVDVRLTMFNDVGDTSEEFGLVVPIPMKLDARHVRLVDIDAMTVIERYAEPRLVEYSCENFYTRDETARANVNPFLPAGCADMGMSNRLWDDAYDTGAPAWYDTATGVTVEENFILGEYEIFVLKAGEADGLMAWMDGYGFVAPPETADVLQDYIDEGQYFLAARVDPEKMRMDWLSPLQLHYQSASTVLPIRLGATSSSGVQDLVVTVINDPNDGRASISNQGPESSMYRDCMVDALDYGEMWTQVSGIPDNAVDAEGIDELAWTTEYSWDVPSAQDQMIWGTGPDGQKCDPCIIVPEAGEEDPLPDWVISELGYPWPSSGYHVTRLRLRYTPGGVVDDLVLYSSGDTTRQQNRYITHKWELESLIPVCDTEQPDDPGACYTSEYWARQAQGQLGDSPQTEATNACGCSSTRGGGAAVAGLLGLLVVGRRRWS